MVITMTPLQMIATIVAAVLASTGFWTFLQKVVSKPRALDKLVLAIVQERFVNLAQDCINRGYVTNQQYKIMMDIYKPYKGADGDGLVDKYWSEVNELPLTEERRNTSEVNG